jgi:hypothetical protein
MLKATREPVAAFKCPIVIFLDQVLIPRSKHLEKDQLKTKRDRSEQTITSPIFVPHRINPKALCLRQVM